MIINNHNNSHPIRARHTVRLSSIRHNYNIVSSYANKQKCSVIVVCKADGYGHGSLQTALHLADYCGADAFAVATIEEGIQLRKAFEKGVSVVGGAAVYNNAANAAVNYSRNVGCLPTSPVTASGISGAAETGVAETGVAETGAAASSGLSGGITSTGSVYSSTNSSIAGPNNVQVLNSSFFTPPTQNSCQQSRHHHIQQVPSTIDIQSQSDVSSIISHTMLKQSTYTTTNSNSNNTTKSATIATTTLTATNNATMPPLSYSSYPYSNTITKTKKTIRSNNIRIIVLGPPTNIPSDFNLYLHYNIEVMISSPTMARNLMIWVADCDGRKIAEVEKVANERKKELLMMNHYRGNGVMIPSPPTSSNITDVNHEDDDSIICNNTFIGRISNGNENVILGNGISGNNGIIPTERGGVGVGIAQNNNIMMKKTTAGQLATLTSVQGNALSKEVRAFLKAKDEAAASAAIVNVPVSINNNNNNNNTKTNNDNHGTGMNINNTNNNNNNIIESGRNHTITNQNLLRNNSTNNNNNNNCNNIPFPFKGIEDTAKESRRRELAAAKLMAHFTGENDIDDDHHANDCDNSHTQQQQQQQQNFINNNNNNISDNESHCYSKKSSNPSTLIFNEDASLLDDSKLVSSVSSAIAKKAIDASTAAAAKMNNNNNNCTPCTAIPIHTTARKKLRWHALIDSGMGRLGFKSTIDDSSHEEIDNDVVNSNANTSNNTNNDHSDEKKVDNNTYITLNSEKAAEKWKIGPHKDTVSILKAMCHAEIDGAPIEFHGMCTHMAEASSNSSYTNEQMTRFKSLLKSVRQAGISVPTISTDNSAALLTTSLTHFDPVELLSQPNADTRGYVRIGGAIFGQRPAFPQLRSVSTLSASVRHVATLMKGETVGYDRAYKAEKDVRIATLSIGFADGYPRELGNGKGKVSIRGEVFSVAGNVCMDMLMVDLGCIDNLSDAGASVSIGDTAYLWGPEADGEERVRLQDTANILNTTQSALTCGLDKIRVQRHYID